MLQRIEVRLCFERKFNDYLPKGQQHSMHFNLFFKKMSQKLHFSSDFTTLFNGNYIGFDPDMTC